MAEIATRPDIYVPEFIDGKYKDYPSINRQWMKANYPTGVKCPCSRKENGFLTCTSFKTHCRGKGHKEYLKQLLQKEQNPLRRAFEAEETVKQQKRIIADLSNQLARLSTNPFDRFK